MFICPIPINNMYIYDEYIRDIYFTNIKIDINNLYIGKVNNISSLLNAYQYDSDQVKKYFNQLQTYPYVLFYNNISEPVKRDLQTGKRTKKFRENFIEPYISVRFATNYLYGFPIIRKYVKQNNGYLYVEKRIIDTKLFMNSQFSERMRRYIRIFACCFPTYKDGCNFIQQLKALHSLCDLKE